MPEKTFFVLLVELQYLLATAITVGGFSRNGDRSLSENYRFSWSKICELKLNLFLAIPLISYDVDCKKSAVFIIFFLLKFESPMVVNSNRLFPS